MTTTATISAAQVSLFHVAAEYLGDATQWWRIAEANNLSDPDLSSFATPVSMIIPDVDLSLTDGVPAND